MLQLIFYLPDTEGTGPRKHEKLIVVDNINVVEVSRQANYQVAETPKGVVRKSKPPQT